MSARRGEQLVPIGIPIIYWNTSIRIYLAQIIFEVLVVYWQYIIDEPVSEIEPRCERFLSC